MPSRLLAGVRIPTLKHVECVVRELIRSVCHAADGPPLQPPHYRVVEDSGRIHTGPAGISGGSCGQRVRPGAKVY